MDLVYRGGKECNSKQTSLMIGFIPESFCDLPRKLSMDAEITRNWNLRLKIRNENVPSFLKSKGWVL